MFEQNPVTHSGDSNILPPPPSPSVNVLPWGMKDGSVGLGVKSKGTMSSKVAERGIVCMNVELGKKSD